jgi:hypothetical protein
MADELPPNPPTEPTLILGKFKSVEDLAASYQNLESEAGRLRNAVKAQTPPTPPTPPAPAPKPTGLQIDTTEPAAPTPPAVPSYEDLEQEYVNNGGSLTDATREKLTKTLGAGWVEKTVEGLEGRRALQFAQAAELVGGQDVLDSIIESAKSLPLKEKQALNAALNGPLWKTALLGLKTQLESTPVIPTNTNNGEPTRTPGVVTGGVVTGGAGGINDVTSLTKAIANPLYRTDPEYRKSVEDASRRVLAGNVQIRRS